MGPTGGTPASEWTIIQAGSAEKACAEAVAAQVRARADFWKSPERLPPVPKPDPKPTRDQKIEVSSNEVRVYASTGSSGIASSASPTPWTRAGRRGSEGSYGLGSPDRPLLRL
jgi:hypothetical protein